MTAATKLVEQPGVYQLPVEEYHDDPVAGGSLSSSGARKLLPPSCPAKFKHWLDEGQEPKREFDLGHAAHKVILGAGPELVVIEAYDYKSKAAQQAQAEARAAGAVPVLEREYEQAQEMAAALREHPVASVLLDPERGEPEQTIVWRDSSGVWCRGLLDFLPHWLGLGDRRLIIPDYKTCKSAAPEDLPKAMASYGYHQQLAWYLDGVDALHLAERQAVGLFIFQEKTRPYLITVAQPDRTALEVARTRNRKAIDIYRRCTETNHWPGYGDEVVELELPPWVQIQFEHAVERGDYEITTEEIA